MSSRARGLTVTCYHRRGTDGGESEWELSSVEDVTVIDKR